MRESDIVSLLPRVVRRSVMSGQPLDALLSTMSQLHEPIEQTLSDVGLLVRPWEAPEAMLPYLAGWLDVDELLSTAADGKQHLQSGSAQLRKLLVAAADLARWRGTVRGLLLFLETATGLTGFTIDERLLDEHGAVVPFTMRVSAPAAAEQLLPLVRRVIETAKPAHVRCLLEVAAPSDTAGGS